LTPPGARASKTQGKTPAIALADRNRSGAAGAVYRDMDLGVADEEALKRLGAAVVAA